MNYETIILEMLSRIQALEEKVQMLSEAVEPSPAEKVTTFDIQQYIERRKRESADRGERYLVLKANEIHKALGLKSRFPMVCNAMRKCMNAGDEVIHETPSGYSSTLEIRYYINNLQ